MIRLFFLTTISLCLAGCSNGAARVPIAKDAPAQDKAAVAPQQTATQQPQPAPAPVAKARLTEDWRDWSALEGSWLFSSDFAGSQAIYPSFDGQVTLIISCDVQNRALSIRFDGGEPADFTILTTFGERRAPTNGRTASVNDLLWDQIAYSRGFFALRFDPYSGYRVPVSPEIVRVIEDCR